MSQGCVWSLVTETIRKEPRICYKGHGTEFYLLICENTWLKYYRVLIKSLRVYKSDINKIYRKMQNPTKRLYYSSIVSLCWSMMLLWWGDKHRLFSHIVETSFSLPWTFFSDLPATTTVTIKITKHSSLYRRMGN